MYSRCAQLLAIMFCLVCLTIATPASGKETGPLSLDLSGAENRWFYGYYGQVGSRGFFGDYDVDRGTTGGSFASLNGWFGNPTTVAGDLANALVSGTNVGISSVALAISPKYGHEWVKLKARYTINPYLTSSAPGAVAPISPGQLTYWTVQADTPLGNIRVGKQVFEKGFDLQFSSNRTTEYLMIERNYCVPNILGYLVASGLLPKRVMSWFNPHLWPRYQAGVKGVDGAKADGGPVDPEYWLFGGDPDTGESRFEIRDKRQLADPDFKATSSETPEEIERKANWPTDDDPYAWGYIGPGSLQIGIGFFPWETPFVFPNPDSSLPILPPATVTTLWNANDLGANQAANLIGHVVYTSGDLEFGVGCLRSTYHQGPELQPGLLARISAPTFERYVAEGWAYIKYNNGQFFFNTELDWFNRVYRFQRSLNGTFFGVPDNIDGSGSLFASRYWESWRYMAEFGAMFGPLVGRVFYCFMPGPDRRHGVYIDRQPFIQELAQQALGLFDPYSILLAYRFGAGVNAPGHISDASVFAVRFDHALAANLIFECSYLRAFRNSHGYAIGYVRPNITPATTAFGQVVYAEPPGSVPTNPAPSIPDRDLGWEIMGGMIWKLTEGWAISSRIAYWQPGKWFNFACVDKGVPNWDIPSAANNWGVRPDRAIDPIIAIELTLSASY